MSVPDHAVITVESLSKRYLIGHESGRDARYGSFRDAVIRQARNMGRAVVDTARGRQIVQGDDVEEFWALRDVSFEVPRGQVLGIIGRNGAGKSTLLKILSRITDPTAGRVRIRGRVASLLEVGTGFHAELTGRENVFLNGAILGMTKAEIKARFDEIVTFAEVERFLDTPVKRYSSGMYVRLAFAVAAHLEPEILIIDEVLAVGDALFQQKCLGKIHDVAERGRTVIFVSHNVSAINALTQRALLLDQGHLIMEGPSREVVSRYLQTGLSQFERSADLSGYRRSHRTEGHVDIKVVTVCGDGRHSESMWYGENLAFNIGLEVFRPLQHAILVVNIINEQMEVLTSLISTDSGTDFTFAPGLHTVRCDAGPLPLIPGNYRLTVGITQSGSSLAWDVLEAVPGFRLGGERNAAWLQAPDRPGVLFVDRCKWKEQP